MTTNMRNLSLGLGAAVASSLVMFVAAPAQAATFVDKDTSYTFLGGVEATFLGNECIASTCVDLATGGYNVIGGGVLYDDRSPIALTPGSDTGEAAKAQVTSYNATASGSTQHSNAISSRNMDTDIKVTGLTKGLFEIYWGSVDSHNVIEFLKGGEVVSTITGTDIARQFTTSPDVPSSNFPNTAGNFGFDAYLKFAGAFDNVRLFTDKTGVGEDSLPGNGISFEVATASKAVPEPTAVMSLLAVGAIVGGSALKRKNQDN